MYAFFAEKAKDKGIDVYAEGQLIIREMLNPMNVGYFRATTATATRFVYFTTPWIQALVVTTSACIHGVGIEVLTALGCSVLQCVAVCCRVLQCVAVCCSVTQARLALLSTASASK